MNASPALPSVLSRRHALRALGVLGGSACLGAWPALAATGPLSEVQIVNRDTGELLPWYRHQGELWVAGEPGARYAIELSNLSRGRLLHVVSVDGINVITGETAALDQAGYVLEPGQRYDVSGWRKSRREIAAFTFTRVDQSYAARTQRPLDVGVIGVAVFRERLDDRERDLQPAPAAPLGRSAPSAREAPAYRGKSHGWDGAPASGAPLGTGHGEREFDRVGRTGFERRSARPDMLLRVRYDSRANLVAQGIIPEWRRPEPYRRPRAFPGARPGYVPDPD